jgi:cell division protein FtsW
MRVSRADMSRFAEWWWSIDRLALMAMMGLIGTGLTLACAASPAATGGPLTAGDFRYAIKQVAFALLAALILGGASLLSLDQIKRAGAVVFALALAGSVLVLATGSEVLGARRWIQIGFMTLQPSEFLKPGFAIVAAWILADRAPRPLPRPLIAALVVLPALVVLALQPDYGQAFLLLALLGTVLFFAGLDLFWIVAAGGAVLAFATAAYLFVGHVHHRVEQYLGANGTGYQAGLALKAFEHGGLIGVGPGAGTIKYRLPDAHSDFIFAVAGEEFGLILCGAIAALFCFLAIRLLLRAAESGQTFTQLAGAGLAAVVALQAFINMGVAVSLLPAKGMTLPFISYGGSSLFAVALTMGFALAMTRARPEIEMRTRERLAHA